MHCKNCQLPLRTDYSYCSNCGAKIIRNRLTFKNLWYDVTERYFNMDNTFLRTFKHMFTKPEVVIEGYIGGIRRKYLNPISCLGIALSLSGVGLFVLRKNMHRMNLDPFGSGNTEGSLKVMQATMDFNTFIYLLYIPLIAMVGWMIYNNKNHNLSEYFVTSVYAFSTFTIASFFFSTAMVLLMPENYMIYSFVYITIMAFYLLYVVRKVHGKNFGLSLAFLLLYGIGFMGISLLLNVLMLLTGIIEFSDLVPKT